MHGGVGSSPNTPRSVGAGKRPSYAAKNIPSTCVWEPRFPVTLVDLLWVCAPPRSEWGG